jgi:hypothetical protein
MLRGSYILLRLRLAWFYYEHKLAVRELQLSGWSTTGICTGYRQDGGIKANLEFKLLYTEQ